MANVKLTWVDASTNEQGFKVYRLKGDTWTGATSESANWVDDATASSENEDGDGTKISPLMTQSTVAGTGGEKGLDAGTAEYVDQNVPTGTWTYRVSAFNEAGETFCEGPLVQPVTITS